MKRTLIKEKSFSDNCFTTTKPCGNMKDSSERFSFLLSENIFPENTVLTDQVHGNNVQIINESDKGSFIKECDALITDDKSIVMGIFTADCMPVMICSKDAAIRAAVHAGWRGLKAGIIEKTINIFKEKFGINPQELKAYIGPHIQECCYEVSPDFEKIFNISLKNGKFNLSKIAENIMKNEGINEVYLSGYCTCCDKNDMFFSYRKDKTEKRVLTLFC